MADEQTKNNEETNEGTNDNDLINTRDMAVQHTTASSLKEVQQPTNDKPVTTSEETPVFAPLTTVNLTPSIGENATGLLFYLNPACTAQPITSTAIKPSMYSNAIFLPQPVSAKLISQVPGVMSLSKPITDLPKSSDVVEKAMDLCNLGNMTNDDGTQHTATNAALTLVSLGSAVGQPVQEIVIDESGRSSFATNSNLEEVSVVTTVVESEGSAPKAMEEPPAMNTIDSSTLVVNTSTGTPVREVVTQTGAGQDEVVVLSSSKVAKAKTLSSYLTQQSLERMRRAEMKNIDAQKQATEKLRIHACEKCEKRFVAKHDLKRHMVVHSDQRPFACTLCDKAFRTKNELNLHIPVHNKDKPYKCEFCDKAFRTKGCFKSHIKYHIGDKRHKCTQCDKAFVKSADLKRHVAAHNNEKNFKCTQCESAFTRKDNLKAHMVLHSRDGVVTCDKCNKEFINGVYLKRHMHVHKQAKKKPYECQWCPKTYEQLEGLRRHIRQHVGDEKFVCEQCAKKFITAIQLKRHMWLCHEQTSPYRKSVL